MNQAPIIALFGLQALLDLYTRRLARLRDTARQRSRLRRPVRDARRLDAYLLADGLDASTVTTDIAALTQDLTVFRWGIPEYREDTAPDAGPARRRGPIDLVPLLRDQLRTQGKRLNSDTASTDGNLRASAALRQAVANTRLQRTVVLVSMVALVIAVIGLIYG